MNHQYIAPLLAKNCSSAKSAPAAVLTDCGWDVGNGFQPLTTVQIAVAKGKKLVVRLFTKEPNPRAKYTQRDDPVWNDSCLEFFFQPIENGAYINLEMNANGAYLSAVGVGREERRFLREITERTVAVQPFRQADGWDVEAQIPFALVEESIGAPFFLNAGDTLRANAYKCADAAEQPHYQALFP
ncbi:MAG TPA: hypothetical protein DDY98_04920, partial [Ruminococcaceae bacterium]|nr:hypothetical protein [Oscillospiraceae bacterium]